MPHLNALAERVAARLDLIADRMVDAFVAEVPVYAHLPQEQLQGEILQICRHNLEIFLRVLSQDELPHRSRAAAALHIHPNTLDYRLNRISELTGFSAGTGRGVLVLGAALTLRAIGRNHNDRLELSGERRWLPHARPD